jgi:hypothetical protein
VKLTEDLAGLRVRAALGRPPQDQLEATVVLESWGVSSDLAFTVAGPDTQAAPMPLWRPYREEQRVADMQNALEVVGLLAGIVAATVWAGPLVFKLGGSAINAWRFALPVTLFVQWALRRYYRSFSERLRTARLSGLRNVVWGLGVAPAIAVAIPVMLLLSPVTGAATSLVVLWTGGLLLTRRGWAAIYVAFLLGGALAVGHQLSVVAVIGGESEAILAMVAVAVATSRPSRHLPGRLREALESGCVGAGLGGLIVSVGFPDGAASVRLLGIAMAPTLLASVVWFYLLAQFWHLFRPTVEVTKASDSLIRTHHLSRLINLAGLTGYVVTAVALSFAALAVACTLGISSRDPSIIFLDLGTIGLAGVLFAWLEVLGRAGTAFLVEACTLGVVLLIHELGIPGLARYGELVTAALAVVLAETVVYRLHRQPEWMAARLL